MMILPKSKRVDVVIYAPPSIEGHGTATALFISMVEPITLPSWDLDKPDLPLFLIMPAHQDMPPLPEYHKQDDNPANFGQMEYAQEQVLSGRPYHEPARPDAPDRIIDEVDGGDLDPPTPPPPPPPPDPVDPADLVIIRTETLADISIWEHHPITKLISHISIPADMTGARVQLSDTHADNALFRIDANGRIWWLATPDYEHPADADADNTYSLEVLFIKDGRAVAKQLDIIIKDIGVGRVGYDPVNQPDGNAELYLYSRTHIPPNEQPTGLTNYLLNVFAFRMPSSGPLTLTWSLGSSIFAANVIRPWLDKAFAAFEAVAHIRFIEIEPYGDADNQRADIDIQFALPEPNSNIRGVAFGDGDDRSMTFYLSTIAMVQKEFNVLLHEIGHTLGLKHPFDNSPGRWPGDAIHRFNPLSIMSYYFPPADSTRLQQADIEALQFLYGAPGQKGQSAERFVPFQPAGHFVVHILENINTSITIFVFTANNTEDTSKVPDHAVLTRSTYELMDQRDADYFVVDLTSGVVRLKQPLLFDTPLDTWGGGYYVGNNVYEIVIKATHYYNSADATPIAPQESYHNLAVTILERINLDAGDSNMDLSASLLGKYITGSDGNNIIRDTIYPDIIIAGKGDDTIYLDSSPYDYNNIIYHIGQRLAWDGADHIIGFSRGSGRQIPDKFIFALESHTATRAISNYQGFLDYVTKGTDTLDDDEFLVQLKIGMDDDGNVQMEGLYFHFAGSPHYHDGRVSLPLVQIQFAEPVNEAGISDIFKDDNNRPVDLTDIVDKNLVLTDLDYLDDILGGENAIDYIIVPELV